MSERLLRTHLPAPAYRKPFLVSAAGHVLFFVFFLFAPDLLPGGEVLVLGTGLGGGQGGDFVTVGLSPELSGGEGMYKPSLTPQPAAVPAPPPRTEPPAEPKEAVPLAKAAPQKAPEPAPPRRAEPARRTAEPPQAGAIPREPEPGSGGSGGTGSGSGGGFGGGQGVRIGAGTGEGTIESWYVRQVEQRIGQNWLRTSLGALANPVHTVVSFEIRADGQIVDIQIDERSGIGSVDLAAERAIRATNPLPPLPFEFRNRRVKFIAHFEYPPR